MKSLKSQGCCNDDEDDIIKMTLMMTTIINEPRRSIFPLLDQPSRSSWHTLVQQSTSSSLKISASYIVIALVATHFAEPSEDLASGRWRKESRPGASSSAMPQLGWEGGPKAPSNNACFDLSQ